MAAVRRSIAVIAARPVSGAGRRESPLMGRAACPLSDAEVRVSGRSFRHRRPSITRPIAAVQRGLAPARRPRFIQRALGAADSETMPTFVCDITRIFLHRKPTLNVLRPSLEKNIVGAESGLAACRKSAALAVADLANRMQLPLPLRLGLNWHMQN